MKKIIKLMMSVAVAVVLMSCAKEGCIDGNAENFCVECKKDDGTCTFKGEHVFWYNKEVYDLAIDEEVEKLIFKVDGKEVGSQKPTQFSSEPKCGDANAINVSMDLGAEKSKSYSYSITDETGYEIWSGSLLFEANTCTAFELKL